MQRSGTALKIGFEWPVAAGWRRASVRALAAYAQLLWRYLRVGHYDVLLVGYPGQLDVFLAHLLSRLSRKPLVWDVLNSLYLICVERGIAARHPRSARLLRPLEKQACASLTV